MSQQFPFLNFIPNREDDLILATWKLLNFNFLLLCFLTCVWISFWQKSFLFVSVSLFSPSKMLRKVCKRLEKLNVLQLISLICGTYLFPFSQQEKTSKWFFTCKEQRNSKETAKEQLRIVYWVAFWSFNNLTLVLCLADFLHLFEWQTLSNKKGKTFLTSLKVVSKENATTQLSPFTLKYKMCWQKSHCSWARNFLGDSWIKIHMRKLHYIYM